MSKVAVVILNWNGKHFFEKFLDTLIKNSEYPGCEIIIADNGSTDRSVEYLKKE
ncbi:MAG: glycosyltransferase, partial [Bacteroidales bacterium]|nr:glycosyltransferase [Bacteroidales bacterium]